MKVKRLLAVCLLVAVLLVVGCAPTKAPKAEVPAGYESIRILGATLGSGATTSVLAYATVLNRYYPEIEWSSCSSPTATNVIYLTKGAAKLALAMPSHYIDAYGFDKIPESRVRSIDLPYATVHYFFLIPEDKPWKNITEVPKGLTVGSGTGSVPVCLDAWLNLSGLSKSDFKILYMGKAENADAWRTGKVDVIFTSISGVTPDLVDMNTSPRKFKALGLSPEQVAKAKAERTFERLGWAAPTQSNVTQICGEIFKYDVSCPQGAMFLSCRDDFPEQIAYKMAKIIDEHHADLVQVYPSMKYGATPSWNIQWAGPPLNIHAGVAKYYREKGYLK